MDDTKGDTAIDPSAPTHDIGARDAREAAPLALARYRLGATLGRGGMGEVISAHDDQIGRAVAIKRMRAADPDPDTVSRFLREAQIQGRLEHPAIVPVHELSRDEGGAPFFVMKQLAGVTLADVLERLAAGEARAVAEFTRQRLLRAFAEVCLAVEFAHTRGVIHRDLKPANIVLGEFGEVYVLDWGIARVADEARVKFGEVITLDDTATTVAGAILGTPGYMSPEQIDGASDLDGRADVYALGCILFEVLALRPLHPRGPAGIASAIAGLEVRPSQHAPDRDIPPELDAACLAATAVARADRHASARVLGDAVQRFLDGDRDFAMRAQLAREALDHAREALDRDPSDQNGEAMRAGARALALDPKGGAAELVGKLMMEPPRETPPEVERKLAADEIENKVKSRKLMLLSGLAYVLFIPLLAWSGFAAWQVGLVAIPALAMIAIGMTVTRRTLPMLSVVTIAVHLGAIAVAARFGSPFLFALPLAVITTMALAMGRVGRPPVIVAWFVLAQLAPWVGEHLGWLSPTATFTDSTLHIHTGAVALDPVASSITLALFTTFMTAMAMLLARIMTNQRLAAQRTTEIQAWRLRQLVDG